MHWTERQTAVTRIGEELCKRGWTLFGYHEDRSDMRTDYYAPASWDGIATHPELSGTVVGVDVTKGTYHNSDIPDCQDTPHRKTWHVERDGKVLRAGVGLSGCAGHDDTWKGKVRQMVDHIESVAYGPTRAPKARMVATTGDYAVTIEHDRDWTWVFFDPKPSKDVRDQLKDMGARWGRKKNGWYFRRNVLDEELAWLTASEPESKSPPEPEIAPLPDGWTIEDIKCLLGKLDDGIRILVADAKLGVPTIHGIADVRHCGMGMMKAETAEYTIMFDAGGGMQRTPSSDKGWTTVQVNDGEFPYDFDDVRATLQAYLVVGDDSDGDSEDVDAVATEPYTLDTWKPWTWTLERWMQMEHTIQRTGPDMRYHPPTGCTGGAVLWPATTSREDVKRKQHSYEIRVALAAGKLVPDRVLADYPGLVNEKGTHTLTFGDNGSQVYFEGDMYMVLNPYLERADGQRSATGWSWYFRSEVETDGEWCLLPDSDLQTNSEDHYVGGQSLKDATAYAERVELVKFNLIGAPDDLPDSYPVYDETDMEPVCVRCKAGHTDDQQYDDDSVLCAECRAYLDEHKDNPVEKAKAKKRKLPDDIPDIIEVDQGHFKGWMTVTAERIKGRWLHYRLPDGQTDKVQVLGRDMLWRVPVAT